MDSKIAAVVRSVPFSMIREMGMRAARYSNVISLGIGEPDLDTHGEICRQALSDALAGATHYTPSQGDPELIDTICTDQKDRRGLRLTPRQVVITGGGMGALTAVFRTLLNPGDGVLVPEPCFPAYRSQIEWAGGTVTFLPTRMESGFLPDLTEMAAALTPRTRVLLLNSPNNPTGAVIPSGLMDEIARFAVEHDLIVVSDEVYDRLVYDDSTHESVYTRPKMADRTVVIHSFSKTYAMTGWRIGYAFGPEWLIGPMAKVVSSTTSCAPSVSQRAALAALRMPPTVVAEIEAAFRRRREMICEALQRIPGIAVTKPRGAFYLLPDIARLTPDSRQFAFDLLDQEQVVVVPGAAFGPSAATCVRIAYTVNRELLAEAVERMDRFVRRRYGV